jgi:hypothetical protein
VCFKHGSSLRRALALNDSILLDRNLRVSSCMSHHKYSLSKVSQPKLQGAVLRLQNKGVYQGKVATAKDSAIMKRAKASKSSVAYTQSKAKRAKYRQKYQ